MQQIKFMSKERNKRAQLLSVIRSKKTLELAAIESLRQASTALDEAIEKCPISVQFKAGESFNRRNTGPYFED